jgi:hypothetical protein
MRIPQKETAPERIMNSRHTRGDAKSLVAIFIRAKRDVMMTSRSELNQVVYGCDEKVSRLRDSPLAG